jgi:hypothetical protein
VRHPPQDIRTLVSSDKSIRTDLLHLWASVARFTSGELEEDVSQFLLSRATRSKPLEDTLATNLEVNTTLDLVVVGRTDELMAWSPQKHLLASKIQRADELTYNLGSHRVREHDWVALR